MIRDALIPNGDWDEPIDEALATQFWNLVSQLVKIQEVRVPRLVGSTPFTTSLVVFCDASAKCVVVVVYALDWSNCFRSRFLVSRSRLAGNRTTPELELHAAVLAVRLLTDVSKCTGIRRWRLYSDASVVLHWIRNYPNKLKKVFVANQVRQILTVTFPDQ